MPSIYVLPEMAHTIQSFFFFFFFFLTLFDVNGDSFLWRFWLGSEMAALRGLADLSLRSQQISSACVLALCSDCYYAPALYEKIFL